MQFHVRLGRFQRRKTELRIKSVRIPRQQDPAAQPLQRRMLHDALHHPLAKPMSAMRFEDKDIAEVRNGREIADDAGKAYLLSRFMINPEA